jgi:hypothetical protein
MTRDLKIDYPVAIDNDYAIWRAFNNQCWPAHYFIDAKGRIRYHHFGEGDYDESERRSSTNGACPAIGRWTQNMVPSTRKTEPSCTGFMHGIFIWCSDRGRKAGRLDSASPSMASCRGTVTARMLTPMDRAS